MGMPSIWSNETLGKQNRSNMSGLDPDAASCLRFADGFCILLFLRACRMCYLSLDDGNSGRVNSSRRSFKSCNSGDDSGNCTQAKKS